MSAPTPASARPAPGPTLAARLAELALVVGAGWVLYALLHALKGHGGALLDAADVPARAADHLGWRLALFAGDMSQAEFYASVLASAGLVLGAAAAWRLRRGFPITYGTGLWPSVLAASTLGLALSVALWGFLTDADHPFPTFVPYVSVPAGVVLVYGAGRRHVLTGAALGALLCPPVADATIRWILEPASLPPVIGNVTGMWLGGILAFELCHRALPWMRLPDPAPEPPPEDDPPDPGVGRPGWLARRTLADFSEAQFFGTELASAGLVAGAALAWVLDAREPVYGLGLLPAVLVSQVMTAALAVFLHTRDWERLGWYPSFVPLVSVAPATVLTFGGGAGPIFAGAVLGALVGPPVAQFVIERIPRHWHPYIGNTLSMAVSTAAVVSALSLLPGWSL